MRFELTLDEIIFIKNTFGFPKLLCVEDKNVSDSIANSLETRQIIANKGSYYELSGEYRLLFKHWSKMRFSVINPADSIENKFYCILANYEAIIIYRQTGTNVIVDFYDFDEKAFCLTGRRFRKKYSLGDPIRIKVVRANLERKQLDFALVE